MHVFFFSYVRACGLFVNDHHISILYLIAFLNCGGNLTPEYDSQKDQCTKGGRRHKKTAKTLQKLSQL